MNSEQLKRSLSYNQDTGVFTWSSLLKTKTSGKKAGSLTKDGITIGLNYKNYRAHRLAFLYMTGEIPFQVDHINLDKTDNRWVNLRSATHAENNRNKKLNGKNKVGMKGVAISHCLSKPFRAWIKVAGKSIHLGYYKRPEDAHAAYRKAAELHFDEFHNFG